jgi:hypothetical protein
MSRIRQFGGNIKFVEGSDPIAEAYVRQATKLYPTDFVNKVNEMGGVQTIWEYDPSIRNYRAEMSYNQQNFVLKMDWGNAVSAIHELNHALEHMPGGLYVEGQYYDRRTAGGTLKELNVLTGNQSYQAGEKAIEFLDPKQAFVHPYMGKDYGGRAYEIFSLGTEFMYYNQYDIWRRDAETVRFIIGLQLGWRP